MSGSAQTSCLVKIRQGTTMAHMWTTAPPSTNVGLSGITGSWILYSNVVLFPRFHLPSDNLGISTPLVSCVGKHILIQLEWLKVHHHNFGHQSCWYDGTHFTRCGLGILCQANTHLLISPSTCWSLEGTDLFRRTLKCVVHIQSIYAIPRSLQGFVTLSFAYMMCESEPGSQDGAWNQWNWN